MNNPKIRPVKKVFFKKACLFPLYKAEQTLNNSLLIPPRKSMEKSSKQLVVKRKTLL